MKVYLNNGEVAKKYTLNGIEVFEIAIFNFTSTAGIDLKMLQLSLLFRRLIFKFYDR